MNARQGKHLRDVVEVGEGGDTAHLPELDRLVDADRYTVATRPEQPYPPAYYPASERRVRWVGRLGPWLEDSNGQERAMELKQKQDSYNAWNQAVRQALTPMDSCTCDHDAAIHFQRGERLLCGAVGCECGDVFIPSPQVVALDLEIAHTISDALRDMWHRGGLEKEAERAWGVLDAAIAAVEEEKS